MKYKRILSILFGTLVAALSYNIFFVPYNIVASGVSGLAIIFKEVFDLNIVITLVLLCLMCWIIGFIFLKKEEIIKSLLIMLLFPCLVYLTNIIIGYIDVSINDNLLAGIVGGMSLGFGVGLVLRESYFITGYDIIVRILEKTFSFNGILTTFVINFVILLIGGYFFGFDIFIYSNIALVSFMLVVDRVILGIDSNKSFYIITSKPEEIKKYVLDDLNHGVTVLKGHGAYSHEKRYILFISIPTRDYYKLRDMLRELDRDAFFVVSSSYEVGGGK